jgi:hypothetical protein
MLVVALAVAITIIERISAESRPAAVELSLDFNAVNAVALHSGVSVKSILDSARAAGASSVVLSEQSLGQGPSSPELLRRRYGMASGTPPRGRFQPEFWNASRPTGFSTEKIKTIESAGLSVVLRPQNAGDPVWLAADKNVTGRKIVLDGKEVPGYPDPADLFEHLPDILLVVLEFTSVSGIEKVKQSFPRRIIQGHTIYPLEQTKNMPDAVWVARWARAVRERGNRFLLVYLRDQETLERNVAYLKTISAAVRREGFQTGVVKAPAYPFGAHTALRLFLAMVCALCFPLGAIAFANKPLHSPLVKYAVTNAVTLLGGLIIASLLFDGAFMQRIVDIPLVKTVMLVPVLLSLGIVFPIKTLGAFWRRPLETRHIFILCVLLSIFVVLMVRAGNTSNDWARPDLGMRQWLESALSVRPRTKEFLFGQPLLFAGFASGNPWMIWLGMIGQVSVINTFLHAHTPVVLSLIRVVYGTLLGGALGWVLAYVIKKYNEWQRKNI